MDPKFYNKNGSLTRYALSCGYVEKKGDVQLYREHNCYHIVMLGSNGEVVRKATDSLKEARQHLSRLYRVSKQMFAETVMATYNSVWENLPTATHIAFRAMFDMIASKLDRIPTDHLLIRIRDVLVAKANKRVIFFIREGKVAGFYRNKSDLPRKSA